MRGAGESLFPEIFWGIAVVIAGILPRLVFVTLFPTKPVSDFQNLVDFAVALRDSGIAKGAWQWQFFNPGMPTLLALILEIFPGRPDTTARLATAVLTGLIPLLPFGIWRGIFSLRTRTLAGLLLALWPGQIFFSGVVAQDNWVLLPAVALACLAVRSMTARTGGYPLWSGMFFVLGFFIRQEMLLVLFPLSLAAAGVVAGSLKIRNLSLLAVTVAVFLLLIASQRAAGTGKFALTTGHFGLSVLGSYVPGAEVTYWKEPQAYIASIDPSLLKDPDRLNRESFRLVLNEFLRRPLFHLVRMVSGVLTCLGLPDVPNFWWSLTAPAVLPQGHQEQAGLFIRIASPLLTGCMLLVHTFFVTSLLFGILRRNWPIVAISAAISLKILVHAIIATQPRYFMVVIALEILVIVLGAHEALKGRRIRSYALTAAGMAVVVLLLGMASSKARAYVLSPGDRAQEIYRFELNDPGMHGSLRCVVEQGVVLAVKNQYALLKPFHVDPVPGETATARCQVSGSGVPVPIVLQIRDPYEQGGLPGRIVQRVAVDGKELFRHDLAAEPGTGWFDVPLGPVGRGTDKSVTIEVIAVHPDPGWAWGAAAETAFQLAVK